MGSSLPTMTTWKLFGTSMQRAFNVCINVFSTVGESLPAEVLEHANTKHVMTRHPTSIMCVGNQEQLATKTAAVLQAKPNSLQKPLHFDGTNSFEQLGSTTFGQRDVACWAENPNLEKVGNSLFWDEPEPTPDVVLHQHPGSVYFGRP